MTTAIIPAEVNVATIVESFFSQMRQQEVAITTALNEMDARHKTERATLVDQLAIVNRALGVVVGKPEKVKAQSSEGTRKPMSEAGRLNIANALKARRERLAAEAAGKAAETVAVPASVAEAPSTTSEVVDPAIKVTALERDVLVGGILKNNFQDGKDGEADIWVDQIIANGATQLVKPKQLPGVVASLSKKGLISTDGEGLKLTVAGLTLARELADAKA